jgi:hypothetical protein
MMAMTTSRQLKQPQLMLVPKYYLLHNIKEDSQVTMYLVREHPELCDFYEEDILNRANLAKPLTSSTRFHLKTLIKNDYWNLISV